MRRRLLGIVMKLTGVAVAFTAAVQPAAAYLFWIPPKFAGAPVQGDEAGLGQPLPGATPAELRANVMWAMRAGLNVAALQCQFSPPLRTVPNYNNLLSQHGKELAAAYTTVSGYFKRTAGRTWQTVLDQYTTRTYNGFSTLHAQLGFCETASMIGRDALDVPRGELHTIVTSRLREFRNSLTPYRDYIYAISPLPYSPLPSFAKDCWSGNTLKKKCAA